MRDFIERHADAIKRLLQILSVILLVGLLGTCFYESDAEKQRKSRMWNPTPENIQYWEEKKRDWLMGRVCETLADEVRRYEKEQIYCSTEFRDVERISRFVADNKPWLNGLGIPREYHSFDAIEVDINSLPCETEVRQWQRCSTGFARGKVY